MTLEDLDKLHRELRRYKYFYYEKHESLISDYDFDHLENKYNIACDRHGINKNQRLDSFVGFSIIMPMSIYEVDIKKGCYKK